MRVVYRLEALADLHAQYTYIAEEPPLAAAHVIADIRKAIRRLELFPYSGRRGVVEGSCELVVPRLPYIVVYRIHEVIEIISVFHTATGEPRV